MRVQIKLRIKQINNEIKELYKKHENEVSFDIIPINIPRYIQKIKALEEEKKKLMEEK